MNSPAAFASFSTNPAYNVKAVCVRTGLSAATLRAWERRYGLPSPDRSGQGYRLYSERDIAMLDWLKRQTDCGINIAHAAAKLRGILESGSPIDLDIPRRVEHTATSWLRSPAILKAEIQDALCQQDKAQFDGLMSEALALYTPETALVALLQGAVRAIRAMKAAGTLSHTTATLALAQAHQYLVHMAQTLPTARGQNKPVAAVGFSSENDFDLMLLSILLRRQRIPTLLLGADLDPRLLEQAAAQLDAGMFVFYADEPHNVVRLVGLSHFKSADGVPMRVACCGLALQLAPEPHIDYLGADLRDVTTRIAEHINHFPRTG